jgi:hypothetical protein
MVALKYHNKMKKALKEKVGNIQSDPSKQEFSTSILNI